MSRKEYMERLDMLLRDIPHTERREALKYYEDYFEDAGEEHEADVIEELGDPEELAKKLREDLKREEREGSPAAKGKQEAVRTGEQTQNRTEDMQGGNYQGRNAQPVNVYPEKTSKKVYNGLTVFFIILGILMGIGRVCRVVRNVVWFTWIPAFESGPIELLTETYEAYGENGVRDLEIKAGYGELIIECWDEEEISLSYPVNYMKVKKEGDELLLEPKRSWGLFRWIGIWDDEEDSYQIVVKIPRDYVFREAYITTGAGTADIERLKAVSLYLKTGAGELDAKEMIATEKIKIEAGVGETVIRHLQASEAEFSIGVGEMSISGRIDGDISAEAAVGELEMMLTNQESDFNYNVTCGVGDISVNGKDYSGIGSSHNENNGAKYDFDMSCGVGSIEVTLTGTQNEK